MADVIARHYLDALNAVPDDPDAAQIRGQAIAALIRAAERAERTGAPARAAASYAAAAELTLAGPPGAAEPQTSAIRRRAVGTRRQSRRHQRATGPRPSSMPGRARDYHLQRGQARAAARAQAIAGRALRRWGRHAEAREQLTAAVEVLRADPDTDTVRALEQLAVAGGIRRLARRRPAHRPRRSSLGQALGVGAEQLSRPAR